MAAGTTPMGSLTGPSELGQVLKQLGGGSAADQQILGAINQDRAALAGMVGGGQQSPMQAANAQNQNNRSRMMMGGPFNSQGLFGAMSPDAQARFGQNFNILDNMPMHDQLNWWGNLFGGQQSWGRMMQAIMQGQGLTGGTPRSGQTG